VHLGLRFERALVYALHVHGGHVRKATDVPYFSHLMAVSATVIENGGSEDEAIAALLHDAVEDQGGRPRLNDIHDRFGPAVADIVEACSDSLDATAGEAKEDWLVRKRRYLAALPSKSPAILRVSAADKLHNARAIYRDVMDLGPALWQRFNRPAEQTVAYYTALHRVLAAAYPAPMTAELGEAIARLEALLDDRARHEAYVEELLASAEGGPSSSSGAASADVRDRA
jgi:(p)ppGpp synthase/HD superfamily hydrolase